MNVVRYIYQHPIRSAARVASWIGLILSTGGVPDDWAAWRGWIGPVMAFFGGTGGQWLLIGAAILLVLWAHWDAILARIAKLLRPVFLIRLVRSSYEFRNRRYVARLAISNQSNRDMPGCRVRLVGVFPHSAKLDARTSQIFRHDPPEVMRWSDTEQPVDAKRERLDLPSKSGEAFIDFALAELDEPECIVIPTSQAPDTLQVHNGAMIVLIRIEANAPRWYFMEKAIKVICPTGSPCITLDWYKPASQSRMPVIAQLTQQAHNCVSGFIDRVKRSPYW